ncbi:aromatic ring-opening dioxygenase LigA [Streptomyces sp. NPDC094032]|uniref:aromatic ring-opening dioxygenase LigA n=1 Tax=Streptomyces sp. NPDC094032 TaxID=3155308 RepID=UPI003323E0D3
MTRAAEQRLAAMRRRLDEPPPENVAGQLAVDVPAVVSPPPESCGYGNPRCEAVPARFYPCGWKCDEHQPARTHRRRTNP